MLKIGEPEDVSRYFITDDGNIVFALHREGFYPAWRDLEGCVYFSKTKKLLKVLTKLGLEEDG